MDRVYVLDPVICLIAVFLLAHDRDHAGMPVIGMNDVRLELDVR